MTLTLWRGDELLGDLFPRASAPQTSNHRTGKPPSFTGFLVRAANAPACEGVWQVAPELPGIGVQQHRVEPDIGAPRHQRAPRPRPSSGPVVLRPMSADEAKGVPLERQLRVRDSSGRVYLPRQLSLVESHFEPEHHAKVLEEAPPSAFVGGVLWTVFIVFASEDDAPTLRGDRTDVPET